MKNKFIHYVFAVLLFSPLPVFAVTIDQSFVLVLPSDSSQYTIAKGGAFDTLTINNASFDFAMSGGQTIRLNSVDRKNLANNFNASTQCSTDYSEVFLNPGSATTITVTPSGSCTSASSGGGSPSISGGGGSVSVPAPIPAPAPAPAPTPTPAPAPISVVPAPASVPAPVAVPPRFVSVLTLGVSGNEVTQLQAFLAKDKTIYPEGIVSGYFGRLTAAAVKRFQAKYGIDQLGIIGPKTRAKLNELMSVPASSVSTPAAPSISAAPGASSADLKKVQELQAQINSLMLLLNQLKAKQGQQ